MKPVCTTCPYCGVGCGLLASGDGSIKGDPDHPSNFGRLCSKGAALGETLGLEERLLSPQVNGAPTDWGSALDLVAGKFSAAIRDHGPDSVAFYVSGQLLSEDYYVANKLMKGFIGSANIDTNSRLCMASTVAGHKRAFGSDTVPGTYEDLDLTDVIVLVGSNLAWCHPVLFQRIQAAKAERPEMKIITIDPRRTATTDGSDLHLSISPDGDAALFNSLLAEIARQGRVDQNYVDFHVNGFELTLSAAQATDPEDTGLSADELQLFHDLWIGSEKVVTVFSQGVNQSVGGTDKVNAILNCHLATGRIGRPGMGPLSVTGQPNAMGGREVGGLANMLACHLDIENADHRKAVQEAWQSPTICTKPGLKAVDLFRACASGQIKALWIMGTNPAVSMPDADAVSQAIKTVDFSVISEVVEHTDTSVMTDVQLPATAWREKTGTVTNSERRISQQRAFLPAPGETRPDWQIICDVARRMGWAEAFSYSSPAEIFREYAALSGQAAGLGRDFDISGLSGISDANYADFQPVQWPIPSESPAADRFFGAGGFFHSDKRARMVPIKATPDILQHGNTFRLNTGRIRDQWHMMTRSGKSPRLSQHQSEPLAEIHPKDADELGLRSDELLEIKSATGRVVVRARITDGTARNTVFAPMHWSGANSASGRVNVAITAVLDPFSGQPALKGGQVKLRRFDALWYGFAVSVAQILPQSAYSAVARTESGWSCEIAGIDVPTSWEQQARKVLNLKTGSISQVRDSAKGITRVAIHEGARLTGLFFVARTPITIDRQRAASQVGSNAQALTALAGLPPIGQPDPGHLVCACFNVGANTIRAAIHQGAATLVDVGNCTAAGTNCGSCKSELQMMINAVPVLAAAE
ncbi:nitrate reductase [Parasedimentitalea maritima]|uniref:Molybdopterin-dependent oxidoreductase n=1 Tax=Parasedimentitalea maritima TaxID=2578117 RepID=A0A6A4RE50_9RHOB|nr:nitrate reductase [Zongyanglinia marina]KAE9629244.1 molybdopterin-dependent oxidoreductase [Zongyanglinia marina]